MKKILIVLLLLIPNLANGSGELGMDREDYYKKARITVCFNIYIDSMGYVSWDERNYMCSDVFRILNKYFEKNKTNFYKLK